MPERDVCAGRYCLLAARQEARRVKAMRITPELLVPVDGPGRDHDQRPAPDALAAYARSRRCDARQERDRRVQPCRLAEDRPQHRQLLGVRKLERTVSDKGIHLFPNRVTQRRFHDKEREQPGEYACRCLVPGKEEHTKLIDELLAIEALPCLRVARGHHRTTNVVKDNAALKTRIDELAEARADPIARALHLGIDRRLLERLRKDQAHEVDLTDTAFEDVEALEHLPRRIRGELGTEDGAAYDVRRELAHCQIKRERPRLDAILVEARLEIVDRSGHARERLAHPHVRERGIDHVSLGAPTRAGRHKHRISDEWFGRIDHQITLRKDSFGIGENLAHQRGLVDDDGLPTGPAQRSERHAIGRSRQQTQQVAFVPERGTRQRDERGKRLGTGRQEARQIGQGAHRFSRITCALRRSGS